MNYFKDFFSTTTHNGYDIINLTRSIKIDDFIDDDIVINYVLKDGETPEVLSNKLYGSTDYWWIFFIINDIIDPFYDWVLSNNELKAFYNKLVADGVISDSTENWNTLVSENNAKRDINVISPSYANEFIFKVQKIIKDII